MTDVVRKAPRGGTLQQNNDKTICQLMKRKEDCIIWGTLGDTIHFLVQGHSTKIITHKHFQEGGLRTLVHLVSITPFLEVGSVFYFVEWPNPCITTACMAECGQLTLEFDENCKNRRR